MANEIDLRVEFFNSFLSCPHRDMDQIQALHKNMDSQDPDFYSHLACWYFNQPNNIRDHNELFCSLLTTDEYIPNRDVGLALFRRHQMSMKNKIVGYIKGKTVKIREKIGMKTIKGKKKQVPDIKITEKKIGLYKNMPTALRTEVAGYLNWLEENPDLFDAEALRNAKALKNLYFSRGKHAFSHGNRAQKVLFDKEYPANSRLSVYKEIMEAKKPEEVAELIVKNKIPYTVAVGLINKITPTILVALVDSMSPQELINNLASLKQNGAYDNPELKKMILAKLEKAKKSRSVAALKGKTAKSTGRIADKEIEDKLDEVADVSVKKAGTIKMKTAVFVDKCVVGDTLLVTEKGLIPIHKFAPYIRTRVNSVPLSLKVATRAGKGETTRLYMNGIKEVRYLRTDKGYRLGASLNHPVLCYDAENAVFIWKEIKDIKVGDYLSLKRGTRCFGDDFSFESFCSKPVYQPNEKIIKIPSKMSPLLGRWLGYLISEGLFSKRGVVFTNKDTYLLDDFIRLSKMVFGLEINIDKSGLNAVLNSSILYDFLREGLGIRSDRSRDCKVPESILMSSEKTQKEFLRGYFSGDGGLMNRCSGIIAATSASGDLLKDIQIMLLNFGIVTRLKSGKSRALNGKRLYRTYHRLTIGGQDSSLFMKMIGFHSKLKNDEVNESIKKRSLTWSARWNNIPGLAYVLKRELKLDKLRKAFPTLACFSNKTTLGGRIASDLLEKINQTICIKDIGNLKEIMESNIYIDKVIDIEKSKEQVYDLNVKKQHNFIGNGIISHNSSSMHTAIDLGKKVAALISGVTEADLYVLAFDTISREIKAQGPTLTDWEKAFASIRPSSMTSIGSTMDFLRRKKYLVEQVVIITDEDENAHPMFIDAYQAYQKEMKIAPQITIINMEPWKNKLSTRLTTAGIQFDRYDPKGGDYYALPGLVTLLSRRSMADLIYEIMDMPLFKRKPYSKPKKKIAA